MRVGMHEMHALRVRGIFRDNDVEIWGAGWNGPAWVIIRRGRWGHDPTLQKPGLPLGRPGGDQNSSSHLLSAEAMTASMS